MDIQNIIGFALVSIDAFIGVIIIIIVLLQGGKIRGIGSAITGTSDSALFEKVKRSSSEKFSTKLSWIFCVIFLALSVAIVILLKHNIIAFS